MALGAGLTRALLPRLVATRMIERIAHGLYRKTSAELIDLDVLEAALRSAQTTICLASALARHDLADEIPDRLHLALPRGRATPVGPKVAAWHQYDPTTFELGRGPIEIAPGVHIGLFGPERTIVDMFNPRFDVPQEQAISALRIWMRRPGTQPTTLLQLAQHWPHALASLLRTLQVLL